MMIKSTIWIFIYMFSSTYCDVCHSSCRQGRTQKLRSAECFGQNLREVPKCLSSNIEVLDLALNRIREISAGDLSKYGYLQILYLNDNVLRNISDEALEDKSDLHTLDISYNVLDNIPKVLFHLPELRQLYLSHIESKDMVNDIESSKPIESPLVYLDLSYNKLPRLPNLGIVPSLIRYNISGNDDVRVSANDFAGLCNLRVLVNDRMSCRFQDQCECWKTELWLRERNVTFTAFNCKHVAECAKAVSPEDLEVYNNCRNLHEDQMLRSFTSKLLMNIGIGASVVIIVLIITLAYIIRRKKHKEKPIKAETLC